MEYIQRAIYGPCHELSYLMHDTIHASDGKSETLCGKKLDAMWFLTGDDKSRKKEVTCRKCKMVINQLVKQRK